MNSNTKEIYLPNEKGSDWKIVLITELREEKNLNLYIHSGKLLLTIRDLIYLNSLCRNFGHKLNSIKSNVPETVVSAKSLSINSELSLVSLNEKSNNLKSGPKNPDKKKDLTFHVGTIRAGSHIKSDGDIFVIGDVNPGAMVSANGNIMIWGKLLGIAHAGKSGNKNAKVSALSLKPVQLRIANIVARGPKEIQSPGLAEQAEISNGLIVINPLRT